MGNRLRCRAGGIKVRLHPGPRVGPCQVEVWRPLPPTCEPCCVAAVMNGSADDCSRDRKLSRGAGQQNRGDSTHTIGSARGKPREVADPARLTARLRILQCRPSGARRGKTRRPCRFSQVARDRTLDQPGQLVPTLSAMHGQITWPPWESRGRSHRLRPKTYNPQLTSAVYRAVAPRTVVIRVSLPG